MGMAIELKNVDLWRRSIDAIASFISEGNFRFNEKGISFKAVDPSQIVLVDYILDRSAFEKFDIEPTYIGVDLVELNKIMQRTLPNDRLTMDITDSELLIRLEGDLVRNFRLPLIEVGDEDINIPQPKFDARIEIAGKIIKEALKDASLFGSSVVLRIKGSQFTIEARGSQGTLKSQTKEAQKVVTKSATEVVSKYSLNFLMNIVKSADPEAKVALELKSDAPMKVSYSIGPAQIQYHLAPMIL